MLLELKLANKILKLLLYLIYLQENDNCNAMILAGHLTNKKAKGKRKLDVSNSSNPHGVPTYSNILNSNLILYIYKEGGEWSFACLPAGRPFVCPFWVSIQNVVLKLRNHPRQKTNSFYLMFIHHRHQVVVFYSRSSIN